MESKIIVHANPVWRDRSNFILRAQTEVGGKPIFEQLWGKKLGPTEFELCCIPFFAYGFALGDRVRTDAGFTISELVESSKRFNLRIWLNKDSVTQGDIERVLIQIGLLFEWHSKRLVAVDLPNETVFRQLEDELQNWKASEEILIENGN